MDLEIGRKDFDSEREDWRNTYIIYIYGLPVIKVFSLHGVTAVTNDGRIMLPSGGDLVFSIARMLYICI